MAVCKAESTGKCFRLVKHRESGALPCGFRGLWNGKHYIQNTALSLQTLSFSGKTALPKRFFILLLLLLLRLVCSRMFPVVPECSQTKIVLVVHDAIFLRLRGFATELVRKWRKGTSRLRVQDSQHSGFRCRLPVYFAVNPQQFQRLCKVPQGNKCAPVL